MPMSKLGVSASANASVGAGSPASKVGGLSSRAGPGGWHPTVLYLLLLIVAEALILSFLSRHLLS